jgi:hypothetical protein
VAQSDDGVRLWLEDKLLIDNWTDHHSTMDWAKIELNGGQRYSLRLEYYQGGGGAYISLKWVPPTAERIDIEEMLRRVEEDGTVLFVLQGADEWADRLGDRGILTYHEKLNLGIYWVGGSYFVRDHPFFEGLPVNQAMNWEYQAFVNYKIRYRFGLIMEGEESVVGCVTGHEHKVATAVGIVEHGKGKIVLSALNIVPQLAFKGGASHVPKAVFCNYLAWLKRSADKQAKKKEE